MIGWSPAGSVPAESGSEAVASGVDGMVRRVVRVLVSLATVAVVSSMLYYFGWVHTAAQARYFGFDSTFYDMSSADYTLRSTDAALPSFAAAVVIVLVLICVVEILGVRLGSPRARSMVSWALSIPGITLMLAGLLGLPSASQSPRRWPAAALLAGGALAGVGLSLSKASVKAVAIFASVLLAVVGAFHAVRIYAASTGVERAERSALEMDSTPIIRIYAVEDPQLLRVSSLRRSVLTSESGETLYRYDCLHLLDRIGDRLFLVPHGYSTDANRRVVYVVDVEQVRVDFDVRYVERSEQPPCG